MFRDLHVAEGSLAKVNRMPKKLSVFGASRPYNRFLVSAVGPKDWNGRVWWMFHELSLKVGCLSKIMVPIQGHLLSKY